MTESLPKLVAALRAYDAKCDRTDQVEKSVRHRSLSRMLYRVQVIYEPWFPVFEYRIVTIEELDHVEHADKYLATHQKNRYVHEVKLLRNDCYFSKSSIRYYISLVLSSAMDIRDNFNYSMDTDNRTVYNRSPTS